MKNLCLYEITEDEYGKGVKELLQAYPYVNNSSELEEYQVTSVGKNILNTPLSIKSEIVVNDIGTVKLKSEEMYTYSGYIDATNAEAGYGYIQINNDDKTVMQYSDPVHAGTNEWREIHFTVPKDLEDDNIRVRFVAYKNDQPITLKHAQLERGSNRTFYEKYVESVNDISPYSQYFDVPLYQNGTVYIEPVAKVTKTYNNGINLDSAGSVNGIKR